MIIVELLLLFFTMTDGKDRGSEGPELEEDID